MIKFGGTCNLQKSHPSSNAKVKGQMSRSAGTKKRKSAEFCSGVVLGGSVLYAGGKINACCLVKWHWHFHTYRYM